MIDIDKLRKEIGYLSDETSDMFDFIADRDIGGGRHRTSAEATASTLE